MPEWLQILIPIFFIVAFGVITIGLIIKKYSDKDKDK